WCSWARHRAGPSAGWSRPAAPAAADRRPARTPWSPPTRAGVAATRSVAEHPELPGPLSCFRAAAGDLDQPDVMEHRRIVAGDRDMPGVADLPPAVAGEVVEIGPVIQQHLAVEQSGHAALAHLHDGGVRRVDLDRLGQPALPVRV